MEMQFPYSSPHINGAPALLEPRLIPPIKINGLSVLGSPDAKNRCQQLILQNLETSSPFTESSASIPEEVLLRHTMYYLSTCQRFLFSWRIWFFSHSSSSKFFFTASKNCALLIPFKSFTTHGYMEGSSFSSLEIEQRQEVI